MAPPLQPSLRAVGIPVTYASMLQSRPQTIPEVEMAMREPLEKDGEKWFHFKKAELDRAASPFRFSVVLKFLKRRPSLDQICLFIKARWGLKAACTACTMQKPRKVFIRLTNEEDFCTVCARESSDIEGAPYRMLIWSQYFNEDNESTLVPVWVFLPGLPSLYYHESMLRIIGGAFGHFLKRDNFMACATWTDGARICVEMDISKTPLKSVWLGAPFHASSRCQEVISETLPEFCHMCRIKGHSERTCRKQKAKEEVPDRNLGIHSIKRQRKAWRKKEEVRDDMMESEDKGQNINQQNGANRNRILQRNQILPSDPILFMNCEGCVYSNVEENVELMRNDLERKENKRPEK